MTSLRFALLGMIAALLAWPLAPVQPASAAPDATINKRVAVLLVNFARQQSEPWTKEFVEEIYFGPNRSVTSYYAELSNGAMSITGSVFGYLTVTSSLTYCDYPTWAASARKRAVANGIDLAAYTNIVYAFPYQPTCWWSGLAKGGSPNRPGRDSWINGLMSLYIASHELGHNFGANHAGALTCTTDGQRVALSSTCTTYEYGDPFDLMGYSGQRHMQPWFRWKVGLLSPSEMVTVSENGVYTLSPGEVSGDGPRMLVVRRPSGGTYVIDFRQPYGKYDDFPDSSPAVTGVSIRLVREGGAPTKLIDTNPDTCTFRDAPLGVGRTFVDAANRIAITTESVGSTSAEIRIETNFDGAAPPNPPTPDPIDDSTPPTAPTSLETALITMRTIAVSWRAADDDVGVDHYLVTRNGILVGSTCDLMLRNIRAADGRTHEFSVQAVDTAGNAGPLEVIRMSMPDVTPPTSPRRLRAGIPNRTTISLRWLPATDKVAVTRYSLRRGGVVIADLEPGVTTYSDGSLVRGRTYRYTLTAIDSANNSSVPATVSVSLP
ncbi:MAG: hypothetical protein ACR2H0_00595 [Candidatus Limnocylindrales bacterium]